ncbi:unnamed protein product [Caenorhabditis nigoni]
MLTDRRLTVNKAGRPRISPTDRRLSQPTADQDDRPPIELTIPFRLMDVQDYAFVKFEQKQAAARAIVQMDDKREEEENHGDTVDAMEEDPEEDDYEDYVRQGGFNEDTNTKTDDEEDIRSERRIGNVRDELDIEYSRILEPGVEEMEVDVTQEASEVVENQLELFRLGRRTDVAN